MLDQDQINVFRSQPVAPQKLFIDGAWVDGTGDDLEVVSPIDGQVLTTLTRGTANDM
ncbi:MAG: gamma-glutamyl-gamma-aminobutyraldehyde dehydrogenase, partial [Paracoccaceae bacterium]